MGKNSAWLEMWQSFEVRLAVWTAALAMLGTILWYVFSRWRVEAKDEPGDASQMMATFRELHEQGELSDEEYRNIKARLTPELRNRPLPRRKAAD